MVAKFSLFRVTTLPIARRSQRRPLAQRTFLVVGEDLILITSIWKRWPTGWMKIRQDGVSPFLKSSIMLANIRLWVVCLSKVNICYCLWLKANSLGVGHVFGCGSGVRYCDLCIFHTHRNVDKKHMSCGQVFLNKDPKFALFHGAAMPTLYPQKTRILRQIARVPKWITKIIPAKYGYWVSVSALNNGSK